MAALLNVYQSVGGAFDREAVERRAVEDYHACYLAELARRHALRAIPPDQWIGDGEARRSRKGGDGAFQESIRFRV